MAKIVGVVASMHRNGLSRKLVESALGGVRAAGGESSLVQLSDYAVPQWSNKNTGKPKELSAAFDGMGGLVICAPVYYLDVNGLAKDFMDTVRLGDAAGKPGLGITVAGGTGKGLTSALKSIYYWFFCHSICGIDPLPVSRFNFEDAIEQAEASGHKLVELAASRPKPFRTLAEGVAHHQALPFMDYEYVDEIALLVRQLLDAPDKKGAEARREARRLYAKGMRLMGQGKKLAAVGPIIKAYEALYY
jgi:NAD(P)H-dependent FMN reductase